MLVIKAIEHAKDIGCDKVYCSTWMTMYAANSLYKKLGFHIVRYITPRTFKLFDCIPYFYFYPILGERIPEFLYEIK